MLRLFYSFLALASLLLLTGCEEKITYSYLMTHPKQLEHKAANCRKQNFAAGSNQEAECKIVQDAMVDFLDLVRQQQSDPEDFGKKILQAEDACVTAKLAMQQAKVVFDKERTPEAEKDFQDKEKVYQTHQEQVRVLLAVASTASPE